MADNAPAENALEDPAPEVEAPGQPLAQEELRYLLSGSPALLTEHETAIKDSWKHSFMATVGRFNDPPTAPAEALAQANEYFAQLDVQYANQKVELLEALIRSILAMQEELNIDRMEERMEEECGVM